MLKNRILVTAERNLAGQGLTNRRESENKIRLALRSHTYVDKMIHWDSWFSRKYSLHKFMVFKVKPTLHSMPRCQKQVSLGLVWRESAIAVLQWFPVLCSRYSRCIQKSWRWTPYVECNVVFPTRTFFSLQPLFPIYIHFFFFVLIHFPLFFSGFWSATGGWGFFSDAFSSKCWPLMNCIQMV